MRKKSTLGGVVGFEKLTKIGGLCGFECVVGKSQLCTLICSQIWRLTLRQPFIEIMCYDNGTIEVSKFNWINTNADKSSLPGFLI